MTHTVSHCVLHVHGVILVTLSYVMLCNAILVTNLT